MTSLSAADSAAPAGERADPAADWAAAAGPAGPELPSGPLTRTWAGVTEEMVVIAETVVIRAEMTVTFLAT